MLSPDEYYRPTRARELRGKAVRLERWERRMPYLGGLCLVLLMLAWLGAHLFRRAPSFAVFWFFILWRPWDRLEQSLARRASRLRDEADELEREHIARYLAGEYRQRIQTSVRRLSEEPDDALARGA